MPNEPLNDQDLSQVARSLAAVRAAEALLRTLGGCTIYVRVPLDVAAPGDPLNSGCSPSLPKTSLCHLW